MTYDPSETRPTSTASTDATTPAEPMRPATAPPTQPVTVVTAPRQRGPLDWLLIGAAVLAVGGVAFAIGRTTAPTAAAVTFPNDAPLDGTGAVMVAPGDSFDPGAAGPGDPVMLGSGGPTIEGTVAAIDATSITLVLASGDRVTIALDDETTYHEATDSDPSAVAVGDDVSVRIDGGRVRFGDGDGGAGTGAAPDLTASDVTVDR